MRIAIISNSKDNWTEDDGEILSRENKVKIIYLTNKGIKGRIKDIWTAWKTIDEVEVIIFWFFTYYSLLVSVIAKLKGKRIIGIASGYDAANQSQLKYGHGRKVHTRIMIKILYIMVDRILAVSNFTKNEVLNYNKNLLNKIMVIEHGFKSVKRPSGDKEKYVLTCLNVNEKTWRLKGGDRVISLAENMPEIEFKIVGDVDECFLKNIKLPENVNILGRVENLRDSNILSKALIYIQLSRYESFGCTVIESIQMGCKVIVSRNGALPEIVEGVGVVVDGDDKDELKFEILKIINYYERNKLKTVKKFVNKYTLERRLVRLSGVLKGLSGDRNN